MRTHPIKIQLSTDSSCRKEDFFFHVFCQNGHLNLSSFEDFPRGIDLKSLLSNRAELQTLSLPAQGWASAALLTVIKDDEALMKQLQGNINFSRLRQSCDLEIPEVFVSYAELCQKQEGACYSLKLPPIDEPPTPDQENYLRGLVLLLAEPLPAVSKLIVAMECMPHSLVPILFQLWPKLQEVCAIDSVGKEHSFSTAEEFVAFRKLSASGSFLLGGRRSVIDCSGSTPSRQSVSLYY